MYTLMFIQLDSPHMSFFTTRRANANIAANKNILWIILGYVSMIGRAKAEQKIINTGVEAIINATNRGAVLVRQLLTIAWKVEVEIKLVDLSVPAEELVKLLRETFPKSIEINTEFAPASWGYARARRVN